MTLRRELLKFAAIVLVGFGLAASQASVSVAQVDPKRPLKVALVLPGPVSDGTFNSAAAKGIKAAQAKYPNITVSIRENTGMAQSEAALFEYASNGYDVVIGHGFQFAEGGEEDPQPVSEDLVHHQHRQNCRGAQSRVVRQPLG